MSGIDIRPGGRPPGQPNPIYALGEHTAVSRPGFAGRMRLPLTLVWYLMRRGGQQASVSRAVVVLPLVAFAAATALALTVLGGVNMFLWSPPPGMQSLGEVYTVCALLAAAVLIVPLLSLGGAAARLSARRRDDRLSTLRLLGATSSTVSTMTVLESAAIAFTGSLLGIVFYLLGAPLVGLIHFGGQAIGSASLMLPPVSVMVVVVVMTLIAVLSAVMGIRGVVLSPLGVRMRTDAPPLKRWLFLVAAISIVVLFGVSQAVGGAGSVAVFLLMLLGLFVGAILLLNLLGPLVIAAIARRQVKKARTAERLMAMRFILESPKAVWRQVGGIAVTSFVAIIAGSGLALMQGTGNDLDDEARIMVGDIATGIYLTIAISFIMVTCSVGVSQAASVYDRSDLYQSLSVLGLSPQRVDRARRTAVLAPLRWVMFVSVTVGGILVFPLVGISIIIAPTNLMTVGGALALGAVLVGCGLLSTRPLLRSVSAYRP
ncbi:FtsX-like permease family protein [Lysinibacter sp. HNR]|uniref:FtsX-like permease family protein n=1 Tax=Lysinibacter sp. HNR TaxID=3031408 RepID=UPI002435CD04|nr:FtsX-like permease family protein [Lysinibacter sp. HNR]WGD36676.1 permease [Lysinibacter sp. HNR]